MLDVKKRNEEKSFVERKPPLDLNSMCYCNKHRPIILLSSPPALFLNPFLSAAFKQTKVLPGRRPEAGVEGLLIFAVREHDPNDWSMLFTENASPSN